MRTKRRRHGRLLLRSHVILCFSTLAWGQLYTGSLAGVVLDPSNTPVAGAKVTLIDTDRGTCADMQTDLSGRYLFRSLAPGAYSLDVGGAGLGVFSLRVAIDVDANLSADARLQLPARRENVLVQDPSPVVNVDSATTGVTLDRNLVNDLPLVNRNPFDLA